VKSEPYVPLLGKVIVIQGPMQYEQPCLLSPALNLHRFVRVTQ